MRSEIKKDSTQEHIDNNREQVLRKHETPLKSNDEVVCPFCKESGFDLIGLKSHLLNEDCEIFNDTENQRRLFK
jgi:hypothetical protein